MTPVSTQDMIEPEAGAGWLLRTPMRAAATDSRTPQLITGTAGLDNAAQGVDGWCFAHRYTGNEVVGSRRVSHHRLVMLVSKHAEAFQIKSGLLILRPELKRHTGNPLSCFTTSSLLAHAQIQSPRIAAHQVQSARARVHRQFRYQVAPSLEEPHVACRDPRFGDWTSPLHQ